MKTRFIICLFVAALLLPLSGQAAQATKVPNSGSVWTDGAQTWAGAEWCGVLGITLKPGGPAVDAGTLTADHCSKPGLNTSGCIEWEGARPDIGACELWPHVTAGARPTAPRNFVVRQ